MPKQQQHAPEKTEPSCVDENIARLKKNAEDRERKRAAFVKSLAAFLVDNQAGKGIALSLPSGVIPWAREWANLRQKSWLHGYPTVEEAEKSLRALLGLS